MREKTILTMSLAAGMLLHAMPVIAQEQSNAWRFRVTPYFVGAAMNGDLTIHGRTATVDVGFDKILENLKFAAMLQLQAQKGRWSIGLDGIYMGLGATASKPEADVTMDQWMVELSGAYQLAPGIEMLAGVRYNALSSSITFENPRLAEKSGNVDWFDPVVGTRLTARLSTQWTLRGRADIGGFNVGSYMTWQAAAYVDFRASDLIAIVGGYRALSNNFETGSGDELFRYDVTVSGPTLGVSFAF